MSRIVQSQKGVSRMPRDHAPQEIHQAHTFVHFFACIEVHGNGVVLVLTRTTPIMLEQSTMGTGDVDVGYQHTHIHILQFEWVGLEVRDDVADHVI